MTSYPHEIGLNFIENDFGFTIAEFTNKPLNDIFVVLAVIASVFSVTSRQNVLRYIRTTFAQWHVMILRQCLSQSFGFSAVSATIVPIIKTALPFSRRKICGEISFVRFSRLIIKDTFSAALLLCPSVHLSNFVSVCLSIAFARFPSCVGCILLFFVLKPFFSILSVLISVSLLYNFSVIRGVSPFLFKSLVSMFAITFLIFDFQTCFTPRMPTAFCINKMKVFSRPWKRLLTFATRFRKFIFLIGARLTNTRYAYQRRIAFCELAYWFRRMAYRAFSLSRFYCSRFQEALFSAKNPIWIALIVKFFAALNTYANAMLACSLSYSFAFIRAINLVLVLRIGELVVANGASFHSNLSSLLLDGGAGAESRYSVVKRLIRPFLARIRYRTALSRFAQPVPTLYEAVAI